MDDLFRKPWREFQWADLAAFFRDADDEGTMWEAKGTELHAKAVRKSVCGFANNELGGYLIFGADQADITTEALQRFITRVPVGKAFKRDMVRTLRAVYAFGVDAYLVRYDPAKRVKAPKPIRGENIIPSESWAEVDRIAAECGRWAPLVVFMVDSGARPAEAVAVEWRHVDLDAGTVELPGSKTEKAWRTVHLTDRGLDAIRLMPRSIVTRTVFHIDGKPISWPYFSQDVWRPALVAAGMPNRAPYNMRHTFAYFSLRAGVPIADLAREMGHEDVSRTFTVYGGWAREMGQRAAELRGAWAEKSAAATMARQPGP